MIIIFNRCTTYRVGNFLVNALGRTDLGTAFGLILLRRGPIGNLGVTPRDLTDWAYLSGMEDSTSSLVTTIIKVPTNIGIPTSVLILLGGESNSLYILAVIGAIPFLI